MTSRRQLIHRLPLPLLLASTLALAACSSTPSKATVAARESAKSACASLQQLTDQLARPRPSSLTDPYYRTAEEYLYTATNRATDAAQQDHGYQEFADTLHRAAQTWQVTFTVDKAEPLIQQARKEKC
ncbi:hypothetical protein OHA09_33615 [Streptomyces longwoodensis]|uniref:hypothetical protein n=1 Tax=Streptomyces longwoodensis TaxID=68231 RepID=UPI0022583739|nr:hypothetical protein [Streptomyces longwoodensis]MCX5000280.1 hypothetical protein [Streptomyces longwoodensis]WTI48985.1 hypothetical protein OG547_32925 [Streptomyces longwoodensis]WUC61689.1 hypothetical protein OHA09_33615 [Streptomyces longwoodensis]WUC75255.1 hypothetical protein OG416_32885 [Streptomyces longwoodensis]